MSRASLRESALSCALAASLLAPAASSQVPASTIDVDDTNSITPLTDGLRILRFLFGFTGATLTSGAVGNDCDRCDAAAIASYIQGLQ